MFELEKEAGRLMAKGKRSMSDPDKDGYPSAVDCSDHNKNKQGAISWVLSKVKGRPYQEVETERKAAQERRHDWHLTRIKRKQEIEEAKAPLREIKQQQAEKQIGISQKRLDLQQKRVKIMEQRQKAMPQMPSLFGGGATKGSMPSLFGSSTMQQEKATLPLKRKRKKRKKKR